jgi:PTH1 family peptidyl-tRNA hydrolase
MPSSQSKATSPILFAGLGNPGRQYRLNRHNVGFMVLDRLVARLGVSFSRVEARALVVRTNFQERPFLLAKPQTYMNLSGGAIASLARFYKVSLEDILIIYDEVDLPLGILRLRPAGGSAGHRGMASIIERLGTQGFPRLRVGVGRPPGRKDAAAHVLQDFSRAETELLPEILDRASDAAMSFAAEGLTTAMNRFNGSNGGIDDP